MKKGCFIIVLRIKEARKAAGLKQTDIARLLEVTAATYSRYENGQIQPDPPTLLKIAAILHTSVDYLLGNDDAPNMPDKITLSQSYSPEEEILIKKYRQLDADGKKEIENMIDFKLQLQNEKSKDTQHKVG